MGKNERMITNSIRKPYYSQASGVNIAEGPGYGVRHLPNRVCLAIETQIHSIIQGEIAARRCVIDGHGATDSVLTVFNILILPDPEHSIDVRMANARSVHTELNSISFKR